MLYCSSCLSSDRCLQPVHTLPDLRSICNGVSFSAEDSICYECKAILTKTWRFKERAVKAMTVLSRFQKSNTLKSSERIDTNSLSSLSHSNVKSTFDAVYNLSNNKNVPQLKVEQIKIENTDKSDDYAVFLEFNVGQSTAATDNEICSWKLEPCEANEKSIDDDEIQHMTSKAETSDHPATIKSSGKSSKQAPKKVEYHQKTFDEEELLQYREKLRIGKTYKGYNYKCEKCVLGWTKQPAWEKHKETHEEKSGRYECHICEQRFPQRKARDTHTLAHYRYYECLQCAFRHHTLGVLTTHVQKCHTEHECKMCHTVLSSYNELKYHTKSAHEKKLKCDICDITFASSWSLSQHMRRHAGLLPVFECAVCHKKLTSKGSLKAHTQIIHAYNGSQLDEGAYCVECELQFKSAQRYRRHLRTSTKHTDARFECADCGLKCSSKSNVRTHIEIHHLRIPRYECKICNQKFITARFRSKHDRATHRGGTPAERKHVCELCGNKFTVAKTLQEHLNSHYGRRPYECAVCGDTFSHSGALYTHNKLVHLKRKIV